tara:strand:- start:35 stop:520 length:486 start_codon:yes stop_codon:yes gene_type:complete
MIHATYLSPIDSYLSLLESRINMVVKEDSLRWLFKFTNDLTKDVKYAYGQIVSQNDRFIKQGFTHNTTEDIVTGRINLKPFGYWTYEVYEVSWGVPTVSIVMSTDTSPLHENHILPQAPENGVVEGKVHEGKLYVTETVGSEQIQYTTHTEGSGTNYLYTD